jgi:hypothetical protein
MIDRLTQLNILPCCFCGNDTDEVLFTEDYYAHVICRKCGACGPYVFVMECEGSAREKAINLWNSRSNG